MSAEAAARDASTSITAAILEGTCTTDTAQQLLKLLQSHERTIKLAGATHARARSTVTATAAKTAARQKDATRRAGTARTKSVDLRQAQGPSLTDGSLSEHGKDCLTTEVVNAVLKVLSRAVKAKQKPHPASPLKEVSENTVKISAQKEKSTATVTTPTVDAAVVAAVECGKAAFAYLQTKLTRDTPPWQFVTGMLAFIGRLVALSLSADASSELRRVRTVFLNHLGRSKAPTTTRPSSKVANRSAKESDVASLVDFTSLSIPDDALQHVIDFQSHALALCHISNKVNTGELYMALRKENHGSPLYLLRRRYGVAPTDDRPLRQLETLSQSILSLCRSLNSSQDCDPKSILQLRALAIEMRIEWMQHSGHEVNFETEIFGPLVSAMVSYQKKAQISAVEQLSLLGEIMRGIEDSSKQLTSSKPRTSTLHYPSRAKISLLLSQVAEKAGDLAASQTWMSIEPPANDHQTEIEATQCTLSLRKTAIAIKTMKSELKKVEAAEKAVEECLLALQGRLKGKPSELKLLFDEINTIRKVSAAVFRSTVDANANAMSPELLARITLLCRAVIVSLVPFLTRILESERCAPSDGAISGQDGQEVVRHLSKACIKSVVTVIDRSPVDAGLLSVARNSAEQCLGLVQSLDPAQSLPSTAKEEFNIGFVKVLLSNMFAALYQKGQKISLNVSEEVVDALHFSCQLLDGVTVAEKSDGKLLTKLHYLGRVLESQRALTDAKKAYKTSLLVATETGIILALSNRAEREPLREVFQCDATAISLGKTLESLMQLIAKSPNQNWSEDVFEPNNMSTEERGLLLEWQLLLLSSWQKSGMLIPYTQHHASHLANSLLQLYDPVTYPVRRARSVALALQLISQDPGLTDAASKIVTLENDPNSEQSADKELFRYHECWKTIVKITLAFQTPSRAAEDMRQALAYWTTVAQDAACALETKVENMDAFVASLKLAAGYFGGNGLHSDELQIRLVLLQILPSLELPHAFIDTARLFHHLGHTGKATELLDRAASFVHNCSASTPLSVSYHVSVVEIALRAGHSEDKSESVSSLEHFISSISTSERTNSSIEKSKLDFEQTLLRASAYHVYSMQLGSRGTMSRSLHFARSAVRWFQRLWRYVNSGARKSSPLVNPEDSEYEGLTVDLSGMKITESGSQGSQSLLYWRLLPLYFRSLLNLCDMLDSCGLVQDALYYGTQAYRLAEAANLPALVARALTIKGYIESRSGDLEQGSLSLSHAKRIYDGLAVCVEASEFYCALAGLHGALEEFEDQDEDFDEAEKVLDAAESISWLIPAWSHPQQAIGHKAQSNSRGEVKAPGKVGHQRKASTPAILPEENTTLSKQNHFMALRLEIQRRVSEALLSRGEVDKCLALVGEQDDRSSAISRPKQLQTQISLLLQRAITELSSDPVYGSLIDSALSLPNSAIAEHVQAQCSPVKKTDKRVVSSSKKLPQYLATVVTLANDAATKFIHQSSPHALRQIFCDWSTALVLRSFEQELGANSTKAAALLDFPASFAACKAISNSMIETISNSDIVDVSTITETVYNVNDAEGALTSILPQSWNVLSLTLSNDLSHLQIVRYRRDRSPFVLRLPLVRQSEHELDDEEIPFGFLDAKLELSDIIEQSDRIVHKARDSPEDLTEKGAKTTWWTEREELDLRLADLLQNIENMWLGGFKGILSSKQRDHGDVQRLQTDMERILDDHLPSRRQQKKRKAQSKTQLHPQIFELFAGLAESNENLMELSESLEDLLYFLVDICQFHGEHNAYDEIDFDAMTVKTLDALHTYREAAVKSSSPPSGLHTILVLDKQLQAIPWESLSCLNGLSVSRVCSVKDIQDRILAMRTQGPHTANDAGVSIKVEKGTYILNPSGDLSRTQKRLEPALGTLDSWTGITNRKPEESEFAAALSPDPSPRPDILTSPEQDFNLNTSLLLYFGHGPGTQYVRHRSIKKLRHANTSCATALLFGCSSASLTIPGEFTEYGTPKSYLHGGAPAVMGSLWDVTDADCDSFARGVLTRWGLCAVDAFPDDDASAKGKKAKSRGKAKGLQTHDLKERIRADISDAQQAGRCLCLAEAVAKSRGDCYLRYLNGAAMVVYGVPVFLDS